LVISADSSANAGAPHSKASTPTMVPMRFAVHTVPSITERLGGGSNGFIDIMRRRKPHSTKEAFEKGVCCRAASTGKIQSSAG
jgi:hypothetical protein